MSNTWVMSANRDGAGFGRDDRPPQIARQPREQTNPGNPREQA